MNETNDSMSRQIKPYKDRLRDELQQFDLYHEKNEGLIMNVALAEILRDNYMDSLKENGPLLRQVGSQGQTKISINPVYVEIRKLLATIINGRAKLGMGNIGRSMEEQTETEFEQFIKDITL